MGVKRRTVWFNDEDWTIMEAIAQERGMNVSSLIRQKFIVGGLGGIAAAPAEPAYVAVEARGSGQQFATTTGTPFSTRPFTPVPKVTPKR